MLGDRISALRRKAGWSQKELAARLGVSPSAVGMYEQDRREPSAEKLVELSSLLGVSLHRLNPSHSVSVDTGKMRNRYLEKKPFG